MISVCDPNQELSQRFSSQYNVKNSSFSEIKSDPEIDGIVLAVPATLHASMAIEAMSAGKHVFVEKPLAMNQKEANAMIVSAKENNVRLMEGFMFRFHPQHQKVKELIEDGKIGEVKSFNGVFGFPIFPEGDIRYASSDMGGGFLLDSGCYPIYASRMIFGEEPEGAFFSGKYTPKIHTDVEGSVMLFYKNQKTATISYANGNYYQAKYEVWGTDGVISVDRAYSVPPDFTTKVTLQYDTENNWEGRRAKIFEIQPKDHFLEMIDTFCLEISGEKKASFNFEQELLNQAKTMEAVQRSNHNVVWLNGIS